MALRRLRWGAVLCSVLLGSFMLNPSTASAAAPSSSDSSVEIPFERYTLDNGWRDWDLEVERGWLWRIRMTTVTEFHGEGKCLTRTRLASKATPLNLIGNLVIAAVLIALAWGAPHRFIWLGATYLMWWAFLEVRHRQMVEGLSRLVANVAREVGFDRVES